MAHPDLIAGETRACTYQVRAESLPFVFESFLAHLAEAEAEEWAKAGQSAATYASALERHVAEFCPSQEQPATDVFPPYDNPHGLDVG